MQEDLSIYCFKNDTSQLLIHFCIHQPPLSAKLRARRAALQLRFGIESVVPDPFGRGPSALKAMVNRKRCCWRGVTCPMRLVTPVISVFHVANMFSSFSLVKHSPDKIVSFPRLPDDSLYAFFFTSCQQWYSLSSGKRLKQNNLCALRFTIKCFILYISS